MQYALSQKKEFLEEFEKLVTSSQKILLVSHIRPDDDAIGSLLALHFYMKKNFPEKEMKMAISFDRQPRWEEITGYDEIQFGKDIANEISEHDLMIIVDTSNYDRVSVRPQIIAGSSCKKICIDNHGSEDRSPFDLLCIDLDTVSASEMVYDLFYQDLVSIAPHEAEAIMVGILGDTIWFTLNLPPKKVKVFRSVARLLEEGSIDLENFKEKFWLESSQTFLIMQNAMSHARFIDIPGWPKFLCSYVDREFFESNKFTDADMSAGVGAYTANFNKTLKDVLWGISLYPRGDGSIKASLRSRPGSVNVRILAETMGLGKGHDGASGMVFSSNGNVLQPEEAIEQFLEFLKNNTPVKYVH